MKTQMQQTAGAGPQVERQRREMGKGSKEWGLSVDHKERCREPVRHCQVLGRSARTACARLRFSPRSSAAKRPSRQPRKEQLWTRRPMVGVQPDSPRWPAYLV